MGTGAGAVPRFACLVVSFLVALMGAEVAPRRAYPLPVGAEGAVPLPVFGALLAKGLAAFLLQLASPRTKLKRRWTGNESDDRK